jgi:hypothetical protein
MCRRCSHYFRTLLSGTYSEEVDEKEMRKSIQVIPSFKNLSNNEERKEWIYDEATCSQFVFSYAELTQRYKNNCKEYFDFYGKVRPDLVNYNKKSITIGSQLILEQAQLI